MASGAGPRLGELAEGHPLLMERAVDVDWDHLIRLHLDALMWPRHLAVCVFRDRQLVCRGSELHHVCLGS